MVSTFLDFKYLFVFLSFFTVTLYAEENVPHDFSIKFKGQEFKKTYSIENLQDQPFGKVIRQENTSGKELFIFQNLEGYTLATGVTRGNENGDYALDIYDAQNALLATVIRKKGIISPPNYQLVDASNKTIAEGSMNWVGSRFVLLDPKNQHKEYVTFYRPYFRLPGDYWYVQVHRQVIDLRMSVLIGAFQTFIDRKNCEITKK